MRNSNIEKIISRGVTPSRSELINELAKLSGVAEACAALLEGHTRGHPITDDGIERISKSLSDATGRKYGETLNGQGPIDWGEK